MFLALSSVMISCVPTLQMQHLWSQTPTDSPPTATGPTATQEVLLEDQFSNVMQTSGIGSEGDMVGSGGNKKIVLNTFSSKQHLLQQSV